MTSDLKVRIEAVPFEPCGRPWRPVVPGFRSILFRFPALQAQGLGAQFECVEAGWEPGRELLAVVRSWAVPAAEFATAGLEFTLWMGRDVGQGRVI